MITVNETFAGPRGFPLAGKYFKLLFSNNPVDIYFFGEGSNSSDQALQVTAGFHAKIDFTRVQVIANVGGDTPKFIVSDDEAGIDAAIVSLGAPITVQKETKVQTLPDVVLGAAGVTAVVAADATRDTLMISNLAANPQKIRVGDPANVGAARGAEVLPGETITLRTTAAVSAFNPGAAAQNVAVLTIND